MAISSRRSGDHDDEVGVGDNCPDLRSTFNSDYPQSLVPSGIEGEYGIPEAEWRRDAEAMGRNELARKYPKAFNAWKNMKGRVRERKAEIDPQFEKFKEFFSHMGPPQQPGDTLDRIDNENRRYGPKLCRWAPKKQQARNRGTTIFVEDDRTGECKPLVQLADEIGVPFRKLSRQRKEGWSVTEMVAQRKDPARQLGEGGDAWPWDLSPDQRATWERQYHQHREEYESGYEFRYEFARRQLKAVVGPLKKGLEDMWLKYAGFDNMEDAANCPEDWDHGEVMQSMPPQVRDEYVRKEALLKRLSYLHDSLVSRYSEIESSNIDRPREKRIKRKKSPTLLDFENM